MNYWNENTLYLYKEICNLNKILLINYGTPKKRYLLYDNYASVIYFQFLTLVELEKSEMIKLAFKLPKTIETHQGDKLNLNEYSHEKVKLLISQELKKSFTYKANPREENKFMNQLIIEVRAGNNYNSIKSNYTGYLNSFLGNNIFPTTDYEAKLPEFTTQMNITLKILLYDNLIQGKKPINNLAIPKPESFENRTVKIMKTDYYYRFWESIFLLEEYGFISIKGLEENFVMIDLSNLLDKLGIDPNFLEWAGIDKEGFDYGKKIESLITSNSSPLDTASTSFENDLFLKENGELYYLQNKISTLKSSSDAYKILKMTMQAQKNLKGEWIKEELIKPKVKSSTEDIYKINRKLKNSPYLVRKMKKKIGIIFFK